MGTGSAQALFAVSGGKGGGGFNNIQSVGQGWPLGEYSPETQAKLAQQERRRQIANMLVQQGLQGGPPTTSAGRFVVPRHWSQNLGDLAKVVAGAYGNYRADEAGREAIKGEDTAYKEAIEQYKGRIKGTPAQPEHFTGGEEPGGEAMPAQPATSETKQQAILEALLQSRIPAVQRYGMMQQGVLDTATAREDTQAARAQEQEQRIGVQQTQAAETARHNKELERLKGDENARNAEIARHNQEMEKIGMLTAQRAGLKPGEVMGKGGQVELRPGTQAYLTQKDKFAKDFGGVKAVEQKTKLALDKIDKILDPKHADAFNSNFGGYTAYATQLMPGKTQDIRNEIESLKQNLKMAGFELIRQGGSIGQMTEREWPIVQDMIARLDPKMSEGEARSHIEAIKEYLLNIQNTAHTVYDTEWQGSQFYKPFGGTAAPAASSAAPVTGPPVTAPTVGGVAPFNDPVKEQRYQEWKAQHK